MADDEYLSLARSLFGTNKTYAGITELVPNWGNRVKKRQRCWEIIINQNLEDSSRNRGQTANARRQALIVELVFQYSCCRNVQDGKRATRTRQFVRTPEELPLASNKTIY